MGMYVPLTRVLALSIPLQHIRQVCIVDIHLLGSLGLVDELRIICWPWSIDGCLGSLVAVGPGAGWGHCIARLHLRDRSWSSPISTGRPADFGTVDGASARRRTLLGIPS